MTRKARLRRSLLKHLKITLTKIEPRVDEMSKIMGNRPEEEIRKLVDYLNNGKELVLNCSTIQFWNVYQISTCAGKLKRLDNELRSFFQIEVPLKIMSTNASIMNGVDELKERLDQLQPIHADGFSGSCGVPGLPDIIVGFNHHLTELKYRLLKDDTKVLVISAPGGYGKTTLAKMLCHDKDIKGKFSRNILYVTVSRPSSLKTIARDLCEHYRVNHHEFRTDEEAKNQIEKILKDNGPGNKLIVLDDLWDDSKSLVENLNFQIQGLKILVTSRFLFQCFSPTYKLGFLDDEDAKTLLCHCASSNGNPIMVPDDLVNKIVKSCNGLPLALSVVGASLRGQPVIVWKDTLKKWSSEGQSLFQSHEDVLLCLQTSFDALDKLKKECFLDMGSFPEDDRIPGTLLMDMWLELYGIDDDGDEDMFAGLNLLDLSFRNLINLIPARKHASGTEGYCSEHYVTQHDLLRDMAIHLCNKEPIVQRKRLFMEINGNKFPIWWSQKTEQPINARIFSISTDETFSSIWLDQNAPNVEVLILNIRSKNYHLPKFIERMSQLKVLIVTGYGAYPTKLEKLEYLASLSSLKIIRFDHVLVYPAIEVIFTLHNLKKLRFVTCGIGNAFESVFIDSHMLPNLTDLEINRCYDLKELPTGLSNILNLEKLSITNCHELNALPEELGNLSNVKTLSLHSCTNLQELPQSIGSMHGLVSIDISDCLNIKVLPEQIGDLSGLNVLNISGCRGLQELPESVSELTQLEDVICDEETSHLWKHTETDLSNVKINVVEEDRLGSFMEIYR